MSEKFPYGYDVNAYIDKAFEQMKADFPWATREMIAENTNLGIEKMDGEYQYVSYHSRYDGTLKAYKEDVDCEEFLRRLASGRDWELGKANPVKERIDVEASNRCSGDWYLECYRIQKHKLGGIRLMSRQATARLVGRRRSSSLLLISNCLGKCSLTSTSIWSSPVHTM